jgi:hypothetical protein
MNVPAARARQEQVFAPLAALNARTSFRRPSNRETAKASSTLPDVGEPSATAMLWIDGTTGIAPNSVAAPVLTFMV